MTTELGRELLEAAQAIAPSIVADRRAIHANPELRYEEVATAAMAAGRLRELGYEVETGIGVTGVMGVLRGGKKPLSRNHRWSSSSYKPGPPSMFLAWS